MENQKSLWIMLEKENRVAYYPQLIPSGIGIQTTSPINRYNSKENHLPLLGRDYATHQQRGKIEDRLLITFLLSLVFGPQLSSVNCVRKVVLGEKKKEMCRLSYKIIQLEEEDCEPSPTWGLYNK